MLATQKFSRERKRMVDEQLKPRGINDRRVLQVMTSTPREEFVLKEDQSKAYEDRALSIGRGQTISQPYIVALMSELLKLSGKEKVLEIGSGSGYQAAILAKLARQVYSLERDAVLARRARRILAKMGIKNVKVLVKDGFKGYPGKAPYEAIILTAVPEKVPEPLLDQLSEEGRLVAPVGDEIGQKLIRIKKIKGKVYEEDFGDCSFVPLVEGVKKGVKK